MESSVEYRCSMFSSFSNGHKTFLVYYIDEPDPNWDGTYVKVVYSSSENVYPLALVEFVRGGTFRFGILNDEVVTKQKIDSVI
jgi:hypothetical protein